jgi:hypothetical protein
MAAASILLFCCCFFFFSNITMFKHDFTSYMFFAPLLLWGGILYVCFYLFVLSIHLESRTPHIAERHNLIYKIVFSLTLLTLLLRSFFGDFAGQAAGEELTSDLLSVPISIVVCAITSGIITWCIPGFRDNDNNEF